MLTPHEFHQGLSLQRSSVPQTWLRLGALHPWVQDLPDYSIIPSGNSETLSGRMVKHGGVSSNSRSRPTRLVHPGVKSAFCWN